MTNSQRKARLEHRCTQCGQANDRFQKWLCTSCYERTYTAERRAQNRIAAKALRVRRLQRGLCTRCGSNPTQRLAWCLDCRIEHAERRSA